jgi:hypothetical protein
MRCRASYTCSLVAPDRDDGAVGEYSGSESELHNHNLRAQADGYFLFLTRLHEYSINRYQHTSYVFICIHLYARIVFSNVVILPILYLASCCLHYKLQSLA